MRTKSLLNDLNLTREEQFIINCLRLEFSREDNNTLAAFDLQSMNWDTVYKKSTDWHIAELLYKIIKKDPSFLEIGKIPKLFLETMRLKYFMSCVAHNSMFKSLYEVLEIFHKAGIKVILLKGSHLAQFVYQDGGVRPMGDIDILVKEDDLQKAEALLLQMGYNNQHENAKARSNPYHLPSFIHPKGKVSLELHRTITKRIWQFNIDVEGIWERTKTVRKNGIDMLIFSLEDLLLHISLHATYHHNLSTLGLVPYCDIATIIDHDNHALDWDRLQARAHEWGISKYLNLSLCLSHEILGAKVSESILSTFRAEPLNKNTVSEARKRILSDVPYPFSVRFHPNDGIMRRMLFIIQRIFIPPKKLAALYSLPENSKRIYLYYGIRFFSLLYRSITFYIYLLTHKKEQIYGNNLDLWLLPGRK